MSTAPATIHDVAKAAGVSVATVSRALNGAGNVLPETRRRVEDAARALRFTPSSAARSLITRRTDTIGALLPDLHGEYFSELIRGIDQAARARGLHLLLSSSHGDAHEAAAALRAMSGRVDGLLVMTPHADADFLRHNLPAGVPAVLLNTSLEVPGLARYRVDNLGGARTMVRHLVGSGRRRVAFIGGPPDNDEAQERLAGYRGGLRPGMREAVFDGDFTEESGWAAGRRIAMSRPRPDAVFAANDMMAVGCLAALREAGLRVPEDVAVAGFDDIPIARYVAPSLTTIRVPIAGLGSAALDALVQAVQAQAARGRAEPAAPAAAAGAGGARRPGRIAPRPDDATRAVTLPVELVVRRSCGAGPPPQPMAAGAPPPH